MTQDLLTDLGEELTMTQGLDALTVTVGVYDDSTDQLSDTSDLGDITTEPTNGNYSRASVTFSAADLSGNWGVDNDTSFSFDFTDVTDPANGQDVDTAFIVYSFQAADTGDSSTQDHLIANPALSQTRNTAYNDAIDIAAGDLSITLD